MEPTTLTVNASDIAGNAGTTVYATELIATLASLAALISALLNLGEIDNAGIANSFQANVGAATSSFNRGQLTAAVNQLNALLNDIAAQRGKHITLRAADLLSGDVSYVRTHLA